MKRSKKLFIVIFVFLTYLIFFKLNIYVKKNIILSNQYFYGFDKDLEISSINISGNRSPKKMNLIILNLIIDNDASLFSFYVQRKNSYIEKKLDIDITSFEIYSGKEKYNTHNINKSFENSWSFIDNKENRRKYLNDDTYFNTIKSTASYVPNRVFVFLSDKSIGEFNFVPYFETNVRLNKESIIKVNYSIDGEVKNPIVFEVLEKKYRLEIITKLSDYLRQF